MEKFLYFGKNPTNVSTRGISFPVYNGDVIIGTREFISKHINPKWLKPLPADDSRKVRHTFRAQTQLLTKDPTGGLPMMSTFGRVPKTKRLERTPFMTETSADFVNPYEITRENRKLEVTTDVALSAFLTVKEGVKIDDEDVGPIAEMNNEGAEDFGSGEEDFDSGEEDTPKIPIEAPKPPISRSSLRKEGASDLKTRFIGIRNAGAPENEALLEDMLYLDVEKATKGEIFPLVWKYYGFDKKE